MTHCPLYHQPRRFWRLSVKVSTIRLVKVRQETYERLKPSGWIYLFTIWRSAVGPIAAWVPERRASTEAADSNIKQKVLKTDPEQTETLTSAFIRADDNQR